MSVNAISIRWTDGRTEARRNDARQRMILIAHISLLLTWVQKCSASTGKIQKYKEKGLHSLSFQKITFIFDYVYKCSLWQVSEKYQPPRSAIMYTVPGAAKEHCASPPTENRSTGRYWQKSEADSGSRDIVRWVSFIPA